MRQLLRGKVALLLTLVACTACGDDPPTGILARWTFTGDAPLSPPGLGPDRRILVGDSSAGNLVTLDDTLGRKVEGPYLLFPTAHAPVAIGADVFMVSSIGRIVRVNLAGETLSSATVQLNRTGPLAVATDGTLRVASTGGRFLILNGEGQLTAEATLPGAAESALAIDSDGVAFAATDNGHLIGIDPAGATAFDQAVNGLASGPSAARGVITVGEIDGVRAFLRDGSEKFRRPRDARVTGTRILDNDEILAWGEDGKLERLSASGELLFSFDAGQPIYAPVAVLANGYGVFDRSGKVHRLNSAGVEEASTDLAGEPLTQIAVTSRGLVVVAVGNQLTALDFAAEM